MSNIIAYGNSHIGQVRKNNEDSFAVHPDLGLFIIADGMGGHNGGEVASAMAVDIIAKIVKTDQNRVSSPDNLLRHAVTEANLAIYEHAKRNSKLQGMGTTSVAAYFQDGHLHIANVGDSRAYLIHDHMLFQLSKDHSLVQEKVNLGIYKREDGQRDKMKNVLVRTVGYEENLDVDVFRYKVIKQDLFILCSDGLHSKVSDEDILWIVNHHIPIPQQASFTHLQTTTEALIQQANLNGGHDNISVIMLLAQ